MKNNYQLMLDKTLDDIVKSGEKPTLLLLACCAPCSSYVLEYLNKYFLITLLFYNPNISPQSEYDFRAAELKRLVDEMPMENKPKIVVCDYDNTPFADISKGLEELPEKGQRCYLCYQLRLAKAAEYAQKNNFEYFCTTLSISPHKNADWLNEIGEALAKNSNTNWLYSDFKKKNGYIRSITLSKEYDLYRQNYCGCIYSKKAYENSLIEN